MAVLMLNPDMPGAGPGVSSPSAMAGISSSYRPDASGLSRAAASVSTDPLFDTLGQGFSNGFSTAKGFLDKFLTARRNFFDLSGTPLADALAANPPSAPTFDPGLPNSGSDASTPSRPDYIYADLAKAYGMDASTAYQEALSNTSYQRAVRDLQAAGINPLLAATNLSGASGVYGAHQIGSGRVSSGVSSAKGASDHKWYKIGRNGGALIGGVLGFGLTGSVGGAASGALLGSQLLGAVGNFADM